MYVKTIHYDSEGIPHNESLYECKTVHFPPDTKGFILETEKPTVSTIDGSVKGQEVVDFGGVPVGFEVRVFVMNSDGKTIDSRRIQG